MQKIISLFQRDYHGTRKVRNEVVPGAEWVINGEGVPTRKWDGTCCLVRDGKFYKRYEHKIGRTAPPNFEPACEPDPVTNKQQGWVPVGDGPEDQYHRQAWSHQPYEDGTYELCGPKVQGNPEGFETHVLIRHGALVLPDPVMHPWPVPRDFDGLRAYFAKTVIEGIVWHHEDGRMVKIKRKDFDYSTPV